MKINWKDHLVNLIVVILGISIAYWLNNWSESKKQAKLERVYLEGIKKDLGEDIEELEYLVDFTEKQIKSLDRITAFIAKRPVAEDSLTNDLFQAQYNLPFTPQNTTYQSLMSSGKMDMIKDFDLRYKVIELYNQGHVSLEIWDDTCADQIDDFVKPIVFEEMTFIAPNRIDFKLFQNRQLSNSFFALRFLQSQRVQNLKRMNQATDSLIQTIDTYLAN